MLLFSGVELFICSILLLIHAPNPVFAATGAPIQPPQGTDLQWSGWGGNVYNNRWAATNTEVNSTTIGGLVQNCKIEYPVGVSATPVVLNSTAYYPTSNGSFYALNMGTCEYDWAINVTKIILDFAPLTGYQIPNCLPISRSSPQIDGNTLYFTTQAHALLVAVDLITGDLLATAQVSDHPLAIVTQSPTVYKGQIFIGASSQEESATLDPAYPCCDFVGVFTSWTFDTKKKTFKQVWVIHTMPLNAGWAGATVWGSQPAIDPVRNQVFIGTGNTYTYPIKYENCVNETASCLPDDVWQESVIALDIQTGKVNWRKSISALDGWVMSCGYAGAPVSLSPLCPDRPGPDADFGMAPTFVPAALGDGTTGKDSLVIGQKSGNLYNFDAVTGDITWHVLTSPKSNVGGLSWGLAVDDTQVFYTGINYGSANWTLQPQQQVTVNYSAFGAANLKTGAINWEVPCPESSHSYAPPVVVNDLVFVGQAGSNASYTALIPGAVLALSKTNGAVLQSWPVDSVQHGGITIDGGFMLFGTGYHYNNPFKTGSFYVYGFPDAIKAAKLVPKATPSPSAATGGEGTTATGAPKATTTKKSAASRVGADAMLNAIYPISFLAALVVWFG